MREILFRGKRKDNGEWVYGGSLLQFASDDSCYIVPSSDIVYIAEDDAGNIIRLASNIAVVIPETVGQFTGLLDKNGTKIFEGDICRNTKTGEIVSVAWHGTMAGFVWNKRKEKSHLFEFGELFRAYDKYEVIGTIHDNEFEDFKNE